MLLAAWGLTLPLAGCGIRLESDAPRVLGTPSPDPAGPAVLAERARVAAILASAARGGSLAAESVPAPVGPLVPIHIRQLAALDAALAALDPPVVAPETAATPGASGRPGTPTAAGTAAGGPGAVTPKPSDVAALEMADLDKAGQLALDDLLPRAAGIVLVSHTQRAVAANLLRAAGVRGIPPPPALPWAAADREIGLRLVEAVRAAAYGVEVHAARTDPARRAGLLAALTRLRRIEAALGELIADLPPRPLGYPLPAEKHLADGVLRRLVDLTLSCATPTSVALQEDAQGSTDDDSAAEAAAAEAPVSPHASAGPPATAGSAASATPPADIESAGAMATLLRLATEVETARLALGGVPVRLLPGLAPEPAATPDASSGPTGAAPSTGTTDPS